MSAEVEALLRRYVEEVWYKGNVAALDDFLARCHRRHVSPTASALTCNDQMQRLVRVRTAFPDTQLPIEDVLAEDDRVACRSTIRGTHRGTFHGIAPTGTHVMVGRPRRHPHRGRPDWRAMGRTRLPGPAAPTGRNGRGAESEQS